MSQNPPTKIPPTYEDWTSVGHRFIKVPNEPGNKDFVAWMRAKHGEPGTVYYAPTGHVQAWQWRVRA